MYAASASNPALSNKIFASRTFKNPHPNFHPCCASTSREDVPMEFEGDVNASSGNSSGRRMEDTSSSTGWHWPGTGYSRSFNDSRGSYTSERNKEYQTAFNSEPWSPFKMFRQQNSSANQVKGNKRKQNVPRDQDTQQEADLRLGVAGLAKRLFRNTKIRQLAQVELDLAAQSEEEIAAPVQRGGTGTNTKSRPMAGSKPSAEFVPPPDFENIKDPRQYKQQYSEWIEYKRRQREQQRFMQQVRQAGVAVMMLQVRQAGVAVMMQQVRQVGVAVMMLQVRQVGVAVMMLQVREVGVAVMMLQVREVGVPAVMQQVREAGVAVMMLQEDEIWDIAKMYLVIAVLAIVVALITGR
ncbi:hypothetical protein CEUSTIGMA_g10566.t1 [Chlamydomonas eustigma]|uniref:Uncharacterized protein n=1 Tax=Chlamydomonas eustigma TaxID=1157962 RepID=A0A250XK09_9CHLO|nr:hypothetical protein CEUSTIGMA_g10566.t1 [Chlamydomonas eustigma]|eukprot:GAX83140.1 hypothetical protein CEUSTIGMA_g10566.t1 [Chlamydomonas eustigma]